MNWRTKALAFRILGRLPFSDRFHYAMQRRLTHQWPRAESQVESLLQRARTTVEDYQRFGGRDLSASTFLEIGAGRDLTVPICLRLLGVGRVVTVDLNRLCRLDLVQHAAAIISDRLGVPVPRLDSWAALEEFGITYMAPCDARHTGLPERSVDCLCSNEVLEHIPAEALQQTMSSVRPLIREGGLGIHRIDYSDHYARSDPSVSRFNFLMFTAGEWAQFNPRLHYVNRLRHSDYLRIFDKAGWEVVSEETDARGPDPAILSRLASEFTAYTPEDLFIQGAQLVLVPRSLSKT